MLGSWSCRIRSLHVARVFVGTASVGTALTQQRIEAQLS